MRVIRGVSACLRVRGRFDVVEFQKVVASWAGRGVSYQPFIGSRVGVIMCLIPWVQWSIAAVALEILRMLDSWRRCLSRLQSFCIVLAVGTCSGDAARYQRGLCVQFVGRRIRL